MDIFDKLKSGEPVDMMSAEYRPAIDELHRADRALFRLAVPHGADGLWNGGGYAAERIAEIFAEAHLLFPFSLRSDFG